MVVELSHAARWCSWRSVPNARPQMDARRRMVSTDDVIIFNKLAVNWQSYLDSLQAALDGTGEPANVNWPGQSPRATIKTLGPETGAGGPPAGGRLARVALNGSMNQRRWTQSHPRPAPTNYGQVSSAESGGGGRTGQERWIDGGGGRVGRVHHGRCGHV